jgi:hypothetical protein
MLKKLFTLSENLRTFFNKKGNTIVEVYYTETYEESLKNSAKKLLTLKEVTQEIPKNIENILQTMAKDYEKEEKKFATEELTHEELESFIHYIKYAADTVHFYLIAYFNTGMQSYLSYIAKQKSEPNCFEVVDNYYANHRALMKAAERVLADCDKELPKDISIILIKMKKKGKEELTPNEKFKFVKYFETAPDKIKSSFQKNFTEEILHHTYMSGLKPEEPKPVFQGPGTLTF